MSNLRTLALSIGLGVASALPLAAQVDSTWTQPLPPFHIAGNLYYVGTKALASYLVTTPNGLILINSDLEQNVPQIKASIEHLGFKFSDVKILRSATHTSTTTPEVPGSRRSPAPSTW